MTKRPGVHCVNYMKSRLFIVSLHLPPQNGAKASSKCTMNSKPCIAWKVANSGESPLYISQ
jgi:hypothetical protein